MFVCKKDITHYLVQPNNSANIRIKNPDIRIKQINRLKSWNPFLFKRIQKSNIWYSVDKKPNIFLNYSDSILRNEYQWQNIWIRFLIIPIRFARSWSDYKDLTSMQAKLWNTTMLILKLLQDIWMVVFFSRENKQRWFGTIF